ncbi:hypothetical protein O6H91_21G038500 [Diphasiastrum complanatum]|uniref:Uncharacterized protein n=1 Tax=Diphasiastrum complanatum TaxID=34168 RepID=A0ACC2AJU2_DIPCM|nr:hypothetical protein O6H91_21G038500 [Diphasiastrum complanatum]
MLKLLGIVDPKHGETWFKYVTTKALEEKGFTMRLEKLNTLRLADVSNEIRYKWLSMCLGGSVMRDQHAIPVGDKPFRLWVGKEVFYYTLLLEANKTLEACQDSGGSCFNCIHKKL